MENIKSHNNLVHSRMVDNELEKFRMKIGKLSSSLIGKMKLTNSDESDDESKSEENSSSTLSEDSVQSVEFIKVSALPKFQEEIQKSANFVCDDESAENHDTRSFLSLPNLSSSDVDDLMLISKFQSVMSIEKLYENPSKEEQEEETKNLDKKIEETQTLICQQIRLEEKNYHQLVVMSNEITMSENCEDENLFEREKIVTDLFHVNENYYENKKLLRTYFKEWLQKMTISKILKTNSFSSEDRIKKINGFLNKIRLEQNKGAPTKAVQEAPKKIQKSVNSACKKDFEHKLKMQQDIIELQKLKIKRQEQLIVDIKLVS